MTREATRFLAAAYVAVVLGVMSGCAAVPSDPNDPFEPANRDFDAINTHLDREILAPVAGAYVEYVPAEMRLGVTNFFNNLDEPHHVLNNLLQGKLGDAASDAGRFVVNSTVGVAGLFDVASGMGLDRHDEDFGQTLGVWGADEGAYLVIPTRGPSSLRDVWDIPVSYFTSPFSYVDLGVYSLPLTALSVLDQRSRLDSVLRLRDESALDPYVFTREAYRQRRVSQIYDGNPPDDAFDTLDQATADAFD